MTRVEKGKKEDKAGVYAIDAFYKYKPEGTVFVYIGWVEGTLKKLEDHKTKYIPNEQLIVSSQYKDMVDFLKKKGIQSKWLLFISTILLYFSFPTYFCLLMR